MTSQATHVVVGIDWGSSSVVSIMGSEEYGENANDLKVSRFWIYFREFTFEKNLQLKIFLKL